ncbi:hypothetical protein Kfla_2747 [Kribbella flavida DSM 17836]|uniref:Fibronectin type III domain protein n=1 Tax=Kribbella flavida (strain DSM 17836 / JCM 10339 / NBRC 14399) TaxID=479435 RepID=D2PZ18_KRIFD|nr:delta-60 repeat domain-containing protein [Kribbella flavida]ADB31812.1 hypothetical protein Kfla_2747 [Kribbella flavida DSM 17836]
MKKLVLVLLTAGAVVAVALIPPGAPVVAAGSGFGTAVSAVRQSSWQTNAPVNAIAIAGNTVFVGGRFTRVRPPGKPAGQGEAVRTYLAAFSRSTGAASSFAPKLNGTVWSIATSLDQKWIVVGGDFTTVNGQPRNRIAMFNAATGALSSFRPSVNSRVKAVAIYGNSVFIGGSFGGVGGSGRKLYETPRNRLAALTLNGGLVMPWNPNANDDVYAIDVADNGTKVYAGGPFTSVRGQRHNTLVALNNSTGIPFAMPAAAAIPQPTALCTTRVKDIDTYGSKVFVANGGDGRGCYDGVLAADIATGKLLWQSKCLGATEAVKAIGSWVYKGSHAHDCSADDPNYFTDGTGTHFLLAHSSGNGRLGPWFPNTDADPNSTTKVGPLAMAGTATDLWVGGDFLKVNGYGQQGVTRFTNAAPGAKAPAPAAPAAKSPVTGKVGLSFRTVVDPDNITLTYKLYQGSRLVGMWNRNTYKWQASQLVTYTDTGAKSGQTVSYRVEVLDGASVVKSATSAPVTVR